MSCFLVSDLTINVIVGYIMSLTDKEGWEHGAALELAKMGLMEGEKLAAKLVEMNALAYEERYGNSASNRSARDEWRKSFEYASSYPNSNNAGRLYVLKKMRCFLCQCSEGDVDKSPLFKVIDDLSKDLALDIVRGSEEYDAAEGWE